MKTEVEVPDSDIVSYLQNLGERKLLSLLLETLENRNEKPAHKRSPWQMYLAIEDGNKTYLIANGKGNWVEDAHLCQFGTCECGRKLISWAKDADCPVCGRKVYLS